jgi:hypothetical protein
MTILRLAFTSRAIHLVGDHHQQLVMDILDIFGLMVIWSHPQLQHDLNWLNPVLMLVLHNVVF